MGAAELAGEACIAEGPGVPRKPSARRRHQPAGLEILHEDRDIIVVNKSAGLLMVGAGRHGGRTAHAALTDYVKKGNLKSRERVFIVHRLERDSSGVLVFARSEEARMTLQDQWRDAEKTYLAYVEGHPEPAEETISSYLAESSALRVYSTRDHQLGKFSQTHYKVLKTVGKRALVELRMITGRRNQIRVHLADRGWPVVGDSKYGRKIRDNKRLALHAHTLGFAHPYNGKSVHFTAPVPDSFHRMASAPPPEPSRNKPGRDGTG